MEIGSMFDPQGPVSRLLRPLGIAASGLSAQSFKMETIAQNIANADATRTAAGAGPYQRQVTQFEALPSPDGAFPGRLGPELSGFYGGPGLELTLPPLPAARGSDGGVRVAAVTIDPTEGPLIYDPGHPDADQAGYVRYPNVDITQETVDMLVARRAYEANATVFQVLKSVLHKALEI